MEVLGVGREPRCGYRISFAVPTKSEGAAAARRVAREVFVDWGLDLDEMMVDSAIVIISELVTNTAKHAALLCRQAEVTLALEYDCLSVAVHDRHPHRPKALLSPHPDDSGGWGLQLVRDLTAEVGGRTEVPADEDGGGKTVRVELPLRANNRYWEYEESAVGAA
jgi:two-component sensor histidine kinase